MAKSPTTTSLTWCEHSRGRPGRRGKTARENDLDGVRDRKPQWRGRSTPRVSLQATEFNFHGAKRTRRNQPTGWDPSLIPEVLKCILTDLDTFLQSSSPTLEKGEGLLGARWGNFNPRLITTQLQMFSNIFQAWLPR